MQQSICCVFQTPACALKQGTLPYCFICGQRCKCWSHQPILTSSVISDIKHIIYICVSIKINYNKPLRLVPMCTSASCLFPCVRLCLRLRLSLPVYSRVYGVVTRVCTLTLGNLCCTAQNEGVDGVFVIWVFGVVDAGIFPARGQS